MADRASGEGRVVPRRAGPGAALYQVLTELIISGASAHDRAGRLHAEAHDVDAVVREPEEGLGAALAALLERARRAGAVRSDLNSLGAVIAAGHAAYVHPE